MNKKYLAIQFILSTIFSLIFSVIGWVLGADYGGNYGFFDFQGLVGYEASGGFVGSITLLFGIWLGLFLSSKLYKKEGNWFFVYLFSLLYFLGEFIAGYFFQWGPKNILMYVFPPVIFLMFGFSFQKKYGRTL